MKHWDSIEELRFCNQAAAIFERHRIATEIFETGLDDYYVARKETVADIINELQELFQKHDFVMPKFPT